MTHRTCKQCGWVHMGVTREHAETEVARFNAFYDAAGEETRRHYSGRSSIKTYERCGQCGVHFTEFRDSALGDCPDGCTIGQIIVEVA